jgi:hypothetical protein
MQQHELIAQISQLFVGTVQDHKTLMESLPNSIPELEKVAARLQILKTQREKTKLDLLRSGLSNTNRNWAVIDSRMGAYFTVQQFRNAITQDPSFKSSLQWDNEPFAQVVQAEQNQQATERKKFALFVGAAKAATAQGVNVAPNQANYELIKGAIFEEARDFNSGNVLDMIFHGGLSLAPNDHAVANALVQQREDQERDRLAEIVVGAMRSWRTQGPGGSIVPDEYGRNQALKQVREFSLEDLRDRVKVIEHNRFLAGRPTEDLLKDEQIDRRDQSGIGSGKPPLPDTNQSGEKIDRAYLLRLSNINLDQFKKLVLRHGFLNVTNRLQGKG